MRIFARSRLTPAATPERIAATLDAEIAVGKRLYAQGVIVEAYMDPHTKSALMIVEGPSIDAVRELFAQYPQVREGLIAFDFTELVGLPAVAAVHADAGTPLPAWWPRDVPL